MRAILFLILAATAGCDDDGDCDPGQHYANGLCYATVDGGVAIDAARDAP